MNPNRTLSPLILKTFSIISGLVLWQIISDFLIRDASIIVSPVTVVRTGYDMLFVTGELYPHVFASSWIFFYGFVLAIVVGAGLGFLMALSPLVRDYVNPWMATLYTTPRIAFAPMLLLWFGIGGGSKVAIVFLGCVFPILARRRIVTQH